MELKQNLIAWAPAAVPPERDTGLGKGHPVDPVRAAGGTEMWSIMKIDTRTISRKEAGSMRDTETGTEKETGITEKNMGGIQCFYGLVSPLLNQD